MSDIAIEAATTIWTRDKTARVADHADECPREAEWFGSLYDQTFDAVYHFAQTLVRDHETAEDVVADTYLKAWRGRLSFSGQGSQLSWVMTIAHNSAMDHLRAHRPNVSLDLFDSVGDPEGPETPGRSISEADLEAIRRAIMRLSPEQQQVIFLRFYQELPHEAVAAKLGKSPTGGPPDPVPGAGAPAEASPRGEP